MSVVLVVIIVADQTHHCNAISELDNMNGVKSGSAVQDKQTEQQEAHDTTWRGPFVNRYGFWSEIAHPDSLLPLQQKVEDPAAGARVHLQQL